MSDLEKVKIILERMKKVGYDVVEPEEADDWPKEDQEQFVANYENEYILNWKQKGDYHE